MPSLNFILPHWLYWSVLLLFPLVAMYLVRRQQRLNPRPRPYLFLAYLFWLCAGFGGMHRFYLRSLWGFIFIPVFLAILYGNDHIRDAREHVSAARAQAETLTSRTERLEARLKAGSQTVTAEQVETAKKELATARTKLQEANDEENHWHTVTRGAALLLLAMLLVDAALLPGLVRRRDAAESAAGYGAAPPMTPAPPVPGAGTGEDPTLKLQTRFTAIVDTINRYAGEYVSYWGVIAVFVYYYEVVARYVFNSPTNWVHESMFLMFGMQYMICGAFGYRDDSHVRVDVFYAKLSDRGKALCDVITSVFFFTFTIVMFVTGVRFALDSINFNEHSFTEWGVQYWPVKLTIPIGAALIVLQGLARLIKDITLLRRGA